MTITKLKQLDEDHLLTHEQYVKLKEALNALDEELPEQKIVQLIKFIGVTNGKFSTS